VILLSAAQRAGLAPAFLCSALAVPCASAQDLIVGGGATRSGEPHETTYGWILAYSHDLTPVLAASVSALNEGHVTGHHRDGHTMQLWARTRAGECMTLAAGIGPYRYFDTAIAENRERFANAHGWGGVASLAATLREPGSRWLYQVRVDRIIAHAAADTTQVLAAVGYRFDQDGSFTANEIARDIPRRHHEVGFLSGRTIINSFDSQTARATSVEYRYTSGPVVRYSLAWLKEGDVRLARRDGIVAQAWLEPSFYRERFTLGVGAGGYIAVDSDHAQGRSALVMLSTTFSYHFAHGWVGRLTWHRVSSNYDRDSDILLAGLGFRF
jgi:hypothetical protein